MSVLEETIYLFLIIFILIFLGDYIIVKRRYIRNKKKNPKDKKIKDLIEISYLVNKFNLDVKKLPINKILLISSVINGFIISLVFVTIRLINTFFILQLLIGFILLIGLIYSIYEIMGRCFVKKGMIKNGRKKN